MRNRIISGLSDAILVIEARVKSGSLITADMGLEQGKDICALPGKATDVLSEGCNNLIKMGAKLVTAPEDILEVFIPGYTKGKEQTGQTGRLLNEPEEKICACLNADPKHVEEIAALTGLPFTQLIEQLLEMELRGLVRQSMKNYYCRL
jgi:DNA processing protein